MLDTLLLRPSLHFTTLHATTIHSTSPHLSTLHFFPLKLHQTTLHSTSLHVTQPQFTPLHYTCRHFTSSHLNFTQLHFPPLRPTTNHSTSLHLSTLHFYRMVSNLRREYAVHRISLTDLAIVEFVSDVWSILLAYWKHKHIPRHNDAAHRSTSPFTANPRHLYKFLQDPILNASNVQGVKIKAGK